MRTERIEGSKYTGFRPVVEIAKDIRKDIKVAKAVGALPSDLKVSVRSRYYAGGQSIDLVWSSSLGTHRLVCSYHRKPWTECVQCDTCNGEYYLSIGLSSHGEQIERRLKLIAHAYNYDNSDPAVDYFDTLFYCSPQWDWRTRLKASNLVGLDPRVAETFITLHINDRNPAWDALQIAQKLEAQS